MNYFTTSTRAAVKDGQSVGEAFTMLTPDAPDWLGQAVMDAHQGEVPNDWRYEICAAIWSELSEYAVGECDDDAIYEMADSLTDVYTHELTTWLASNLDRAAQVDEYLNDMGATSLNEGGIAQLLAAVQCRTIEQMAMILRDARDENADLDETSNS